MDEIGLINKAMAALEAQRPMIGDAVVDAALAPLREKLALLQPQPTADQRKLVTVLFADLVGFTSMSEHKEPFRVLLTCFQVLRAANDPRAGTLLHAARRLLQEQADRLGDETLRRSFLGNVPANREIMAEWEGRTS
jgi:hypothetical protein